jgi:hypothetical protein
MQHSTWSADFPSNNLIKKFILILDTPSAELGWASSAPKGHTVTGRGYLKPPLPNPQAVEKVLGMPQQCGKESTVISRRTITPCLSVAQSV